nr:MAG TPA: Minor structural protein [Caudoviricetes sp.]
MYSVTDAFNSACAAPGREITSKILFNGTKELAASEVQEISITEQFGSSDGVTIGAAFSSQCKVVIYKQTPALPLSGGNFTPYAGIMVDGAAQFVPKGKFYIPSDGVEKTGDLWLTITGYDRMAGLTTEYVPTIQFPATPTQMLVDVCTQAHVTAPSVTMPAIQIAAPYTGSLRQQLGWLAGLIGCNAKFDATGNLVFFWYADNGLTLGWDVQYMDGLELTADGAFTINSLLTGTEENPISVGTGLGITSTNPYMTAEQATVVLAQISGKSLMPCKLKWSGNPAVEAGDSVTVTGRDGKALTVYVMEQRMTIKGGMSADITCYGPEDAEYAVESPTQKKVQRQYDDVRKAFQDATSRIIGAKGGYFEITYDDDGFPTGWVIRNTPSVEDDTKMWIMSAGGLGYSSDGGKTVTDIALTDDGKILGSALIIKQDDVDGLSAALSAINGELTSKITRAEAESEIKQTADALTVRITGLDDDLQLITKSFHVGDDGLVIGETDNPIKLRLDNDTLQFLRDNVAELEITADGVVAKRLTVSTIMIGEVLIQADDNGDVIIA